MIIKDEKIILERPLTLDKIIEDEEEYEVEQTFLLSDNWQKHLKILRG